MRAVFTLLVPRKAEAFVEDTAIWQALRDVGLERGRLRKDFLEASRQALTAEDIRAKLVADIKPLLSYIPVDDRSDAEEEVVYSSVLPTRHGARNVRFFIERPNGSDIRVRVFAAELAVTLDAAEYLISLLTSGLTLDSPFILASDVSILEDGQTQTVIVGEEVGYGWWSRIRWAARQSVMPTPVAAAALVLGCGLLAASAFFRVLPGFGAPLVATAVLYTLGVANAARKAGGIEWRVAYVPRRPNGMALRAPRKRTARPSRRQSRRRPSPAV